MEKIEDFYESSKKIVSVFERFALDYDLVNFARADHICYKCGSSESFERIRRLFETNNLWIRQPILGGRRIAVIRLTNPIRTVLGDISLFELPDQKPDGSQTDGFHHIEVYPVGISYDQLVLHLQDGGHEVVEVKRPHHDTHDINMGNGFLLRLTKESLMDKIREQLK